MSIHQMRQTYTLSGLQENDVDRDPIVQFEKWFQEAQSSDLPDWVEVNAMTLSTSDKAGCVTSRIVLLKGIEDGKFVFFTNYGSTKGGQIEANPSVSLCFFWPHLQRQVCIAGTALKTSREVSQTYFHSRPRGSQLGANVSMQSSEVTASDLQSRMSELEQKYADQEIPCPDHWGGYEVTPSTIEFWQGRPSRLHDRIVFRKSDKAWNIVRLSP
ncbi:Pyridoxine/pyridoxamine 5'-phosphate oxidase [Rubripirellula obstinata]|uniref:Pyridoxine/pyridoxamine 5'-phosphate oxidase n=1 Tax=Rubripirellula obstinata TaxID=406547 RepID=A0A5B1CHV7_9BACT|nr:pyridoxamine 5'-phosphate oxidase [Rubripirellula obstinata]KAA1260777.1 Pyridoxine/pyridoxamine 5'-phosphate oxidase [Rubripirellula obstinata]